MISKKYIFGGIMLAAALSATAQREYSPTLSIGGKGGVTLSNISFTPNVHEKIKPGITAGFAISYAEEKNVGLLAEVNFAQRGWAEGYKPGEHYQYSRTLSYVSVPVMAHIFFGPRRTKFFFNLGPEVAFLIHESIKSNFDYSLVGIDVDGKPVNFIDYPGLRETEQLNMEIQHKIDYGINGGFGCEWRATPEQSILFEARYYFGLGNIFPSTKADYFSASRGNSFSITAGYMFRLK